MKAVTEEDYKKFKGKGRIKKPITVLVSDSNSDFEASSVIKPDCVSDRKNGTVAIDIVNSIDQRLKNLEMKLSSFSEVVLLGEQVVKLEADNRALSKCANDIKESLMCMICRNVADFPWMVTYCCGVVMCLSCLERWSTVQPTCLHCRAELSITSCQEVRCIRSLAQKISEWRGDMQSLSHKMIDKLMQCA